MVIRVSIDISGIAKVYSRDTGFVWSGLSPLWLSQWMAGRREAFFVASDEIPLTSGLPVILAEHSGW